MDKIMQNLVNTLNKKMINPDKDVDSLLEELNDIGLFYKDEEFGWYYDNE
jgi:hypothetical protein